MAVIGYLYGAAGYQYVGLAKKLYDNTWAMRQFYDRVEKQYPEFKINKLSFMGPEDELLREENGLIINSVYQAGLFEVLKEQKVHPEQMAGYKSGEIMALAAAQAMHFDDAMAFLFKKREIISQEVGKGFFHHMLVNLLPLSAAEKIVAEVKQASGAEIISYNNADSTVIACRSEFKEKLKEVFKKLKAAVIDIPHEEFACMQILKPVADRLKDEFNKIKLDKPVNRIVCQTTGQYYESVQEIKERFTDYIYKPSRVDIVLDTMLKNGVNTFVEMGSGTFLSRMAKKRDSGKRCLNTNDLGEVSKTVKLAN